MNTITEAPTCVTRAVELVFAKMPEGLMPILIERDCDQPVDDLFHDAKFIDPVVAQELAVLPLR